LSLILAALALLTLPRDHPIQQAAAQLYFGGGELPVVPNVDASRVLDATAAINAAISSALANGRRGISLMPGIYELSKTATGSDGSAVALLISGASNGFTLDCSGSTLSFNGSAPSNYAHVIRIENSSKVTLKDCQLDWSAPPYTQATLSAINASSADFQIDPAYPIAWTSVQQIEEFIPSAAVGVPAGWVR
jgi:hypothetical protein